MRVTFMSKEKVDVGRFDAAADRRGGAEVRRRRERDVTLAATTDRMWDRARSSPRPAR